MTAKILAVDDIPQNLRLLEAVLVPQGYTVVTAGTGEEALLKVIDEKPDLILLDIVLPGIDGYEVCKRIRADEKTAFLPIVMITASGAPERRRALEVGADDFVPKPFDQLELLARVKSLLRLKTYHDTIEQQNEELERWTRSLVERVAEQVDELSRLGRLRRFLAPQVAELVTSHGGEAMLEGHRREITVVFCDLRGFTAFSEDADPEEALGMLRAYHSAMGELIFKHEGTLEHFAGDGIMTFFNDPIEIPDAPLRAARMAVAMRARFEDLATGWRKRGHELGLGVGLALGHATLGRIGFEGRFDYAAVGRVVIRGSRLSAEAKPGQILMDQRVYAAVEDHVEAESVGEVTLKGLNRPIQAFNIIALRDAVAT